MGSPFVVRGIIEGFFGEGFSEEGPTWTPAQRHTLIDWLGDHRFNTYVYACKCDPFTKRLWRDPYPPNELEEIARLGRHATARGLRFVFALSPGEDFHHVGEDRTTDTQALVTKLNVLWDVGIRHFALLFDDTLPHVMRRHGHELCGKEQGNTANYIRAALLQRTPEDEEREGMWFTVCPAYYCGSPPTSPSRDAYWQGLHKTLDPCIDLLWTGSHVVAPTVSAEYSRQLVSFFSGRNLVLWDNYPVNDYASGYVFLQPYRGRDGSLHQHWKGILSNPCLEIAAAQALPLFTFADYLHDPEHYHPLVSVRRAVETMIPVSTEKMRTEVVEDMLWLVAHAPGSNLHPSGWWDREERTACDTGEDPYDWISSFEVLDEVEALARVEEWKTRTERVRTSNLLPTEVVHDLRVWWDAMYCRKGHALFM